MNPEQNGWWDRTLTIAVITAVAAILGAAVGATATYYGNRDLQEEQSEATARGVARVLIAQFIATRVRLEIALEQNSLIPPDPVSSVALSTDDEQLLAANLDSDAWAKVVLALVDLQIEKELTEPSSQNMPALEAEAGRRVPLSPRMREHNRATAKNLEDAIEALDSLAET